MTRAREPDGRLDVAIVGAGIGGLAAAIRLRQLGYRVTLLEQARQILPVGAGIQLAQVAESWSAVAEVAEVTAAIDGWDDRAIRLVASAESVHRTGLFDREPLDTWTEGRVALLGDACHPMLPYQAQGAAQALEDAEVLGDELAGASSDGVEAALSAYADRRRSRAAAVQRASRSNRQLFHLPDGPEQQKRDGALANLSGDFDSYAWIWDDGTRKET